MFHMQMSPQAVDIGELPSADSAYRLSIMALHMFAERGPIAVVGAAYWALLASALTCGHERDSDSKLQHPRCR